MEFEIIQPGPGRLIRALMDEIKVISTINSIVSWDEKQWHISPGELIAAIIISCFCRRQALYKLEKFYQHQDLELLFGRKNITADDFTDDSLGRALDRVSEAPGESIFGAIVLNAKDIHKFSQEIIHADTTSITVYGEYNFPNEEEPLIALGFSKEHRPDLQQYMLGLVVNSDGIPLFGKPLAGNTSDKQWNQELFKEFQTNLTEYLNSTIVADSQAVTNGNLKLLKGVKFISRFPETYSLCEELKRRAWSQNKWNDAGRLAESKNSATYQVQEFIDQIEDENYRFVVVQSSSLDKAKEKSIQKSIANELQLLKKESAKLEKTEFACEPDAKQAWERFLKTIQAQYYQLTMILIQEVVPEKRDQRGRPKATDPLPGVKTVWRVIPQTPELDSGAVKKAYDLARTFVLISSCSTEPASDVELLKHYKDQNKIENRFKFLKDPYYVGAVFLKKPERIRAFNYVLLIALLLYSLLERRVRLALVAENQPFWVAGSYKTFRPSGKTILESLDYVTLGIFRDVNGFRREIPANIRKELSHLIRLAGFDIDIYTIPPVLSDDG